MLKSCVINKQIEFKFGDGHTIYFENVRSIRRFMNRRKEDPLFRNAFISILEKDPNLERPEDVGKVL